MIIDIIVFFLYDYTKYTGNSDRTRKTNHLCHNAVGFQIMHSNPCQRSRWINHSYNIKKLLGWFESQSCCSIVPLQFTLFTCKSCLHRLVDDALMFEFGLPFHPSFHHCRLWLHGSNWPSGRSADRQISRGRTRGERMGKVSGGVFISFIFQYLSIPGTFQVLWLWSILCHRVYRSGVIKASACMS